MNRLPKTTENDIGLNFTPLLMQQPLTPEYIRQRCVHESSPGFDGVSTKRQIRAFPIDPQLLACFKMPNNYQHTCNEQNDNSGGECSANCHNHQDEEGIDTDERNISGTNKPIFNCHHISYNGNYEGDISMFAKQQKTTPKLFNRRLPRQRGHYQPDNPEHSPDSTDSEHDVCRKFSRVVITEMAREQNPTLAALQRAANTIFTQKQQNQLKTVINWLHQSIILQFILSIVSKISILLVFTFLYLYKTTIVLSKFIVKMQIKNYIRSHIRKILWFFTLLKRNDTLLFGSLIIGTPWLFLMSVFGFTFSLYYDLKRLVIIIIHFIKKRVNR